MDSHGLRPVLHYQSKSRIEDKVRQGGETGREERGLGPWSGEPTAWEAVTTPPLKAAPLPRLRSCWTVEKTISVCQTYSWKCLGE